MNKGYVLTNLRYDIENADCKIFDIKSAKASLKDQKVNSYALFKDSEDGPYKAVIVTSIDGAGKRHYESIKAYTREDLNNQVYEKFERESHPKSITPILVE